MEEIGTFGWLCDYETGRRIRRATAAERVVSTHAALRDNTGAFTDHGRTVYVEGGYLLDALLCLRELDGPEAWPTYTAAIQASCVDDLDLLQPAAALAERRRRESNGLRPAL